MAGIPIPWEESLKLAAISSCRQHASVKKTAAILLIACIVLGAFNFWKSDQLFDALSQLPSLSFSYPFIITARARYEARVLIYSKKHSDIQGQTDHNKKSSQLPFPENMVAEAAETIHNIPLPPALFLNAQGIGRSSKCGRFPVFMEIHFSSIYWQIAELSSGPHYLYNAYLDNRRGNPLGASIKIKTAVEIAKPDRKVFCQIWFKGETEPVISESVNYTTLHYSFLKFQPKLDQGPGIMYPYYLNCPLPQSHRHLVPLSVSVVDKPCDYATNNLRVIYDIPEPGKKREGFVVCPRPFEFLYDNSIRIIEWVEMLRALGASKIVIFDLLVHPNAAKVLEYYHQTGFLEHITYTLPGHFPTDPELRHMFLERFNDAFLRNVFAFTDCVYRNMYRYKYVANFDVDEVIMPLKSSNWNGLVKDSMTAAGWSSKSSNLTQSSLCFRNTFYVSDMMPPNSSFPGIPKQYFHMLHHVYRAKEPLEIGRGTKCFHDLDKIITIHNHYPILCLGDQPCAPYDVPENIGHVQHYRNACYSGILPEHCGHEFSDTNIWRFKRQVIHRASKVLKNLEFI